MLSEPGFFCLQHFQKNKLKKTYDYFWGYKLLAGASKVLALTETEYDQYKVMGVKEDKIDIVPNGINLTDYRNLPERSVFRNRYGIKENEKMILYLGRITRTKGIDLIVKILPKLLKDIKNLKFVIVGSDDGFFKYIKKLIENLDLKNEIFFTENKESIEKKWFKKADNDLLNIENNLNDKKIPFSTDS